MTRRQPYCAWTPTTHQFIGGEETEWWSNQCMGMIRRPWWSEANGRIWPGCRDYTPTLFRRISWDHRESGPLLNVSSEGRDLFSVSNYIVTITLKNCSINAYVIKLIQTYSTWLYVNSTLICTYTFWICSKTLIDSGTKYHYCVLLTDGKFFVVASFGTIFIGKSKTDKVTGNIVSKLHKKQYHTWSHAVGLNQHSCMCNIA